YLNFIITNKVVIGQSCWREGMPDELKLKDENAAQILQSVFPDRKIIMIDALAVNLGGGGIHCISMHQPLFSFN
ncbi:MAG TPA: peptidylarginine deiminase, partial [Arenibacter sp.]|nr:peptidylarginine deiminase [Arenibacter sp.]